MNQGCVQHFPNVYTNIHTGYIPGVGGDTVMSAGTPVLIVSQLTSSVLPTLRFINPEGERLDGERLKGELGGSPLGKGWRVGPGGGDVGSGGGVGSLSFLGVLVTVTTPVVVIPGVFEPTGSSSSENYEEKIHVLQSVIASILLTVLLLHRPEIKGTI